MSTVRGKCAYLKVFDSHRILAVAKDQVGKWGTTQRRRLKTTQRLHSLIFFSLSSKDSLIPKVSKASASSTVDLSLCTFSGAL